MLFFKFKRFKLYFFIYLTKKLFKGDEQEATIDSFHEEGLVYVNWFQDKKLYGKKIPRSEIISFQEQNNFQAVRTRLSSLLQVCLHSDDLQTIRFYVFIVYIALIAFLAHVLFIHECYCNYNDTMLVILIFGIFFST